MALQCKSMSMIKEIMGLYNGTNLSGIPGLFLLPDYSEATKKIVSFLLARGADVNQTLANGNGTLLTAFTGHGDCIFIHHLLAMKADPNIPDKSGRTPIMIAVLECGELNRQLIEILGEVTDFNKAPQNSIFSMTILYAEFCEEVIEILFNKRFGDVNALNGFALKMACRYRNFSIVAMLVGRGARVFGDVTQYICGIGGNLKKENGDVDEIPENRSTDMIQILTLLVEACNLNLSDVNMVTIKKLCPPKIHDWIASRRVLSGDITDNHVSF